MYILVSYSPLITYNYTWIDSSEVFRKLCTKISNYPQISIESTKDVWRSRPILSLTPNLLTFSLIKIPGDVYRHCSNFQGHQRRYSNAATLWSYRLLQALVTVILEEALGPKTDCLHDGEQLFQGDDEEQSGSRWPGQGKGVEETLGPKADWHDA